MAKASEEVLAARIGRAGERADCVLEFARSVMAAIHARSEISGDQHIVQSFVARGMSTLRAVRLLVQHDLAGDATSTMRTLVELDIDLAYILLKPEPRLQRFYEYDFVVFARMIEDNPDAVPKEVADAARTRRDQVWKHYKDHKFRWSKASIRERAQESSRLRAYLGAYALGCHASHSGMGTLGYSRDVGNETVTLSTTTQRATAEPINFAAMALFRLVCEVAQYFQIDCKPDVDRTAAVFDDAANER